MDAFFQIGQSLQSKWHDHNYYKYRVIFLDIFELVFGPFDLMVEINIMNGRIVLVSDPSIFTNDMINRGDNRIFTIELFTYLAQQANANTIIVDHNHLSWLPTTPALLVGLIIGQITYVSTNWLLAPLAPILALWMVYRYLPFSRPEKQTPREIYRLKGETHFSRTLQEFITKQRYDEALRIIYGRLKRDLRRKYGLRVFDVSRLMVSLSKTRQPSDISLLDADLIDLEKATQESRRINRDQFLDLFFKIKRIRDNIG